MARKGRVGRDGPGADGRQEPLGEERLRLPEALPQAVWAKHRPPPPFPGFLPWISPFGMDLDFRGIQGKPEATGTCLQRELFGPERQSWEVEVPPLTFPGDPLQAGLGILLYQHTVVEYLLCAGPRPGRVMPS